MASTGTWQRCPRQTDPSPAAHLGPLENSHHKLDTTATIWCKDPQVRVTGVREKLRHGGGTNWWPRASITITILGGGASIPTPIGVLPAELAYVNGIAGSINAWDWDNPSGFIGAFALGRGWTVNLETVVRKKMLIVYQDEG